ncbi:hypothetical protein KX928_12895 [Roseobacter sp. YSTF-M11]|uniref:Uncharacterized protein n=1 Tax=Roseobacter insulae TaxID=2859783 RepID=A0A9X1FVW1_9RHOB|nr:hypothetical protein [Roseobacter insulae]MBW4708681.1 hypothetical protein [Roseobacter insulae]
MDSQEIDASSADAGADPLIEQLKALPHSERTRQALRIAARLVEFSAFELAGTHTATYVADLINCAAKLDRSSAEVFEIFREPPVGALRRVQ